MEEPGAICRGTVDCHSFCLFDALLFLSGMLGTRLNHPYVLCSVRSQAPRSSMTLSCPRITLFPVFFIPREAIWWSLPSQG